MGIEKMNSQEAEFLNLLVTFLRNSTEAEQAELIKEVKELSQV